jgi:hypothetical protein
MGEELFFCQSCEDANRTPTVRRCVTAPAQTRCGEGDRPFC